MNRRDFIRSAVAGTVLVAARGLGAEIAKRRMPNILLILADDVGCGDLGSYGQKVIRTPRLDRLAADGVRFTQFYSGSAADAPARCMLLTGKHAGHASIRDNRDIGLPENFEGQMPLPPEDITVAQALKDAGYSTACIGQWGLGRAGSTGDPNAHGFDLFWGYNCLRQSRDCYPAFLMCNKERVVLPGNDGGGGTGQTYAPDRIAEEALQYIRVNRDKPFFLCFSTPLPRQTSQIPEESLKEYAGKIEEPASRSGQAHKTPRAARAAMVTRMDRHVGQLMLLIEDLGLQNDTLIIFTSGTSAPADGGADPAFFGSNCGLRGAKGDLYEGGLRVPMIARWPGRIKPAALAAPCGGWDLFPTLCEAAGLQAPGGIDGISLLPQMLGGAPAARGPMYWEFPGRGGQQAVRLGDWKGIRRQMAAEGNLRIELYNLAADPAEENDVAAAHPDVILRMEESLAKAHTPSPAFPLKPVDPAAPTPAGKAETPS